MRPRSKACPLARTESIRHGRSLSDEYVLVARRTTSPTRTLPRHTHGSLSQHVRLSNAKGCVSEPWKGAQETSRQPAEEGKEAGSFGRGGDVSVTTQRRPDPHRHPGSGPCERRRRGGRTENQFYGAAVKEVKHLLAPANCSFYYYYFLRDRSLKGTCTCSST